MTQVLKFETVARNAMQALFEGKLGIQLGVEECLYEYNDKRQSALPYLWGDLFDASKKDRARLEELQHWHDSLIPADIPVEVKVEKMRDYLRGVLGTQVITWEEFLKANREALFDGRLALMREECEKCRYTYEGSKARCTVGTVLTDDTIMKMDSSAADEDRREYCPITGVEVAMLEKRGFVAFENDRVRDRIILLQKMHDTLLLQYNSISLYTKKMMYDTLLNEVAY